MNYSPTHWLALRRVWTVNNASQQRLVRRTLPLFDWRDASRRAIFCALLRACLVSMIHGRGRYILCGKKIFRERFASGDLTRLRHLD